MGNKKRMDTLDAMIDTILLSGPIKRTKIPSATGVAMRTIDEWINIMQKIQEMPRLIVSGEGRNMTLAFDVGSAEETHLQNAVAFFNTVNEKEPESEKEDTDKEEIEYIEELLHGATEMKPEDEEDVEEEEALSDILDDLLDGIEES